MNEGWIKIHRKILNWQWFGNINVFYLFTNLLLRANISDSKEGSEIVRRGEIMTTIPQLSEMTGLTTSQIRTSIDKLKLSGELTVRTSNKYRIITICNFDTYQLEEESGSQTKSQTNRRQIADKSQTKQEREEKIPSSPKPLISFQEEEKEELEEERKELSGDNSKRNFEVPKIYENFDLSFVSEDYREPFFKWLEYKISERNERYKTQTSLETVYKKLVRESLNVPSNATIIIESAIGNRYQGFFPLKNNQQQYGNNNGIYTGRRAGQSIEELAKRTATRICSSEDASSIDVPF